MSFCQVLSHYLTELPSKQGDWSNCVLGLLSFDGRACSIQARSRALFALVSCDTIWSNCSAHLFAFPLLFGCSGGLQVTIYHHGSIGSCQVGYACALLVADCAAVAHYHGSILLANSVRHLAVLAEKLGLERFRRFWLVFCRSRFCHGKLLPDITPIIVGMLTCMCSMPLWKAKVQKVGRSGN